MTQGWRKLGQMIVPDATRPWMATHAMLPVACIRGSMARIYFTGRDAAGRGAIGWCDADVANRPSLIAVADAPLLSAGPLGAFDDSGVSSSAVVDVAGRTFLYYTGWTRGVSVPFYVFLGLAVSDNGGATFRRVSSAPILERTDADPYLTGHPAVLYENGTWRMWYVSCSEWRVVDGQPRHYYRIKYAESSDGIHWQRTGRVCIDYANAEEYAIARPWVVRSPNGYRMWFSHRGTTYRIGYAESLDGLTWTRADHRVGIDLSADGWDAESIEYPCVFAAGGRDIMLYNGNGYGRTGIGVAVADPVAHDAPSLT